MDTQTLARRLAAGGTVQELTSPSRPEGSNQILRISSASGSRILKVYGSDAHQRREHHALDSLVGAAGLPRILESGIEDGMHWSVFVDAGRWNLQTLPENPGLARKAGEALRDLHQCDISVFSNLERGIDQDWISLDFKSTLRRLERYRSRVGVARSFIDLALDLNPPFATTPAVAHTDSVPRNFVVNDAGNVTLIAWEWATLAPIEWDLSRSVWLLGLQAGPRAAVAFAEGYGRTFDAILLDRWIVYHAAQMLITHTQNTMSIRPDDVPDGLVDAFNRAVVGASTTGR